jgi:hypothetical protein
LQNGYLILNSHAKSGVLVGTLRPQRARGTLRTQIDVRLLTSRGSVVIGLSSSPRLTARGRAPDRRTGA